MSNLLKFWVLVVRSVRFRAAILRRVGALICLTVSYAMHADVVHADVVIEAAPSENTLQSEVIESQPPNLSVRPAVILDRSYTIQIGLYDQREDAVAIVTEYQLDSNEAGIAVVTVDGVQKYLLAYGIYSSADAAEVVVRQLEAQIPNGLKVALLSEIEAISQTLDESPEVRTF